MVCRCHTVVFPNCFVESPLVWITCPLWLERWNRWIGSSSKKIQSLIQTCRQHLLNEELKKSAIISFPHEKLYLQTAVLNTSDVVMEDFKPFSDELLCLTQNSGLITQLLRKLIVLTDEDCLALVETGLQREVRVALEEKSKTVKGGSFRSEEAIPPEAVLFFPWGIKPSKPFKPDPNEKDPQKAEADAKRKVEADAKVRAAIADLLKQRLQFGGLEGLGRGWADLQTIGITRENKQ